MTTPSSLTSHFIPVNGCRLHYLQSTTAPKSDWEDQHTLVFLHGFPEHAGVWQPQLQFFGKHHRAVALDLPGYSLSEGPQKASDYTVPNLVGIVAKFIESISPKKKVTLIAHDWGGALAWPLTARFHNLIERLVIMNAAHPSTFTRETIRNRQQRLMSDYIHTFLDPNAEQALSANTFELLKAHSINQIRRPLTDAEIAGYETAWARPNAVTNMLSYYRCMPQLFPRESDTPANADDSGPLTTLDQMNIPEISIPVPTLVLWGEDDAAFDIGVLDGLSGYIEDLTIHRFEGVSHWIQHEASEQVNQLIDDFLDN